MEAGTHTATNRAGRGGLGKRTLIRVVAVLAIAGAAVVGLVAWMLIDRAGNDSAATTATTALTAKVGPVVVSEKTLSALVANVGHPVYWAGPSAGVRTEFTKTTTARVYVRYLPQGVKAGDPATDYLIVATYPFPNAYNALKKSAKGQEVTIPGGGIAVVSAGHPTSVHFAYPGSAYQGEIYDPSAAKALKVASSGDIQPVP